MLSSTFFCFFFLARGNISQHSSGLLVALLDQAQKLEPQSSPPVVVLETSKKYVSQHSLNKHLNIDKIIEICLYSFQYLSYSQARSHWRHREKSREMNVIYGIRLKVYILLRYIFTLVK